MDVSYYLLLFIISIFLLIIILFIKNTRTESFNTDQTQIPKDEPAKLSWNFESLKSSIKNFNETNEVRQGLNVLRGDTSSIIGLNQPIANWIYPYTFLNRKWDRILLDLTIKIEKDFNNNRMLEQSNNKEWKTKYPYVEVKWSLVPEILKNVIIDVVGEINRRFNITPPSVAYKKDIIKYYWISHSEVIIIITVYKAYTACDIEYPIDVSTTINNDLKLDFERELLIYIDQLDDQKKFHLKYLRFPQITYDKNDGLESMRSIKEFDNLFYLAKSKDFYYHTYTNTEARDEYLLKVEETKAKQDYKCFGQNDYIQQSLQQTDDQTTCELADGYWDKKCKVDTDCPYFHANKNYPNNFGGCNVKTGFCKWPSGLKSFSYRKPRGFENLMCYNCIDGNLGSFTIGKCCTEQFDARKYANLLTPDYAFPYDIEQRFKYRALFDRYNLNWSKFV